MSSWKDFVKKNYHKVIHVKPKERFGALSKMRGGMLEPEEDTEEDEEDDNEDTQRPSSQVKVTMKMRNGKRQKTAAKTAKKTAAKACGPEYARVTRALTRQPTCQYHLRPATGRGEMAEWSKARPC